MAKMSKRSDESGYGGDDLESSMQSLSSTYSCLSSITEREVYYKTCPSHITFVSGQHTKKESEKTTSDIRIDEWRLGFVVEHESQCVEMFERLNKIRSTELKLEKANVEKEIFVAITAEELDDLDRDSWIASITDCIKTYLSEKIDDKVLDFKEKEEEWTTFATRKLLLLGGDAGTGKSELNVYVENKTEIHIVGFALQVEHFAEKCLDTVLNDHVDRRRTTVTDNEKKLFEVMLEQVFRKSCPKVDIHCDTGESSVEIEGLSKDVEAAEHVLKEMLENHTFVKATLSERKRKFLQSRSKTPAKQYVTRSLKRKGCKWILDGNNIIIFGHVLNIVDEKEVLDLLVEVEYDLTEIESTALFVSGKWRTEKEQLETDHEAYMKIEEDLTKKKLFLVCTANVKVLVQGKIQNFRESRRVEYVHHLDDITEYRMRHLAEHLETLRKEEFLEHINQGDRIRFEGTQRGIEQIKNVLSTQHTNEEVMTFKVVGEADPMGYLRSSDGRKMLKDVESNTDAVIRPKVAPKLVLVEENIQEQMTSVIVNSVSPNLDLNVGQPKIAMSVYEKGGREFQQKLLRDHPQGIKYNDMVVSPAAGGLICNWVFNCCLEGHKTNSKTEQDLAHMITSCLKETTKDPKKYKSIAIPALGTGVLGYPADLAAKATFDTIVNFFSTNVGSQLELIKIVIFPGAPPQVKQKFSEEYDRRVRSAYPLLDLSTDNIASGYLTIVSANQQAAQAIINTLNQRMRDRRRHDFARAQPDNS